MKYNPRVNELVARTEALAWAHPYQPESLSQGCLAIIAEVERALAEITGMDAVTLATGRRRTRRDDRHHDDPVAIGIAGQSAASEF